MSALKTFQILSFRTKNSFNVRINDSDVFATRFKPNNSISKCTGSKWKLAIELPAKLFVESIELFFGKTLCPKNSVKFHIRPRSKYIFVHSLRYTSRTYVNQHKLSLKHFNTPFRIVINKEHYSEPFFVKAKTKFSLKSDKLCSKVCILPPSPKPQTRAISTDTGAIEERFAALEQEINELKKTSAPYCKTFQFEIMGKFNEYARKINAVHKALHSVRKFIVQTRQRVEFLECDGSLYTEKDFMDFVKDLFPEELNEKKNNLLANRVQQVPSSS